MPTSFAPGTDNSDSGFPLYTSAAYAASCTTATDDRIRADGPLTFGIKGARGTAVPPALITSYKTSGQHSANNVTRYLEEVAGPLRGGDPGVLLLKRGNAPLPDAVLAPAQGEGLWLIALHDAFTRDRNAVRAAPRVGATDAVASAEARSACRTSSWGWRIAAASTCWRRSWASRTAPFSTSSKAAPMRLTRSRARAT